MRAEQKQMAEQMNTAALSFSEVCFSHEQHQVLNNISFSIQKGERVALAGSNGSGKSTLAKLANGLFLADKGEISVFGQKLARHNIHELRAKIGYLFASPDNQFFGLTVEDDIAFGLENLCLPREEIKSRVMHYAELFQLLSLLERHPGTLSGGQKQRAALAAVMAMEPELIILDEATSMLDASFRTSFLDQLYKAAERNKQTIITISHDTQDLLRADRLLLLSEGTIIADGKPEQLMLDAELLERCRLQAPYALELCKELRQQGIPIGMHANVQEVLQELWALQSSSLHSATKTAEPFYHQR